MPECPKCERTYRSRKAGTCPGCGVQVELVAGEWIMNGEGAPSVQVVQHFEAWISRRETGKHNRPVRYQIPRRSNTYRIELSTAKRMLNKASGDVRLVCGALDILFGRFAGKNCTSLLMLQRDYPLALTLAQAKQAAEEEKEQLEQETLDALSDRLDLFLQ